MLPETLSAWGFPEIGAPNLKPNSRILIKIGYPSFAETPIHPKLRTSSLSRVPQTGCQKLLPNLLQSSGCRARFWPSGLGFRGLGFRVPDRFRSGGLSSLLLCGLGLVGGRV